MAIKNNKIKTNTICFVAGKSGGHIIPCITLAQKFMRQNPKTTILFFSNNRQLDKKILKNLTCVTHHIMLPISTFFYKKIYAYPRIIAELFYAFGVSFYYLYREKPSTIISTGSLITLPVSFAAFLLRIPLTLYELNAIPGKTTKILIPFAHRIYYCFESVSQHLPLKKSRKIDYPIRFSSQYRTMLPDQARKELQLDPHKKTITILGGSQGSIFINNLIKKWITLHPNIQNNIQVIHQIGTEDPFNWHAFYQQLHISARVYTYHGDPVLWYAASNLILCRAGAGTLFETVFFGKQCITIPLETATTAHQINNAQAVTTRYPNQFIRLNQKKLTTKPEQLFIHLNKLYAVSDIDI